MKQTFSIILPVYNGGEYLKECVYSILSQTIQDFNLIVLDNCSNDGTLEWLKSLNKEQIIIHPADKHTSIEDNWARIKSVPKNKFITLIGHDDILNSNYLEVMNALIQKYPSASLYQAHYDYIDHDGKMLRHCLPMDEVQQAHEFLALYICGLIDSTGTGYIMRSDDYDRCGGINPDYKNLIFADLDLWISLAELSFKATSLDTAFKYRIHNSVSKLTNGQEYQEAFGKFIMCLSKKRHEHKNIGLIIDRYGKQFLLAYCEAISHRILKTPRSKRQIDVKAFIQKCREYAEILIPGQKFEPANAFRTKIAKRIDNNFLARYFFQAWKR